MPEKLYTTEEVAEILRVTKWTVREYLKSGKLEGIKRGHWKVPESSLQKYLETLHG